MEQTKPTTCTPWCVDHDNTTDDCFGACQHVGLSLEPPVVQSAQLGTLNGEPVIVLFRSDGNGGATLTPQEAARYAVQLWALAAQAQAGKVRA